MKDKARVIGAYTPDGHVARFPLLPKELSIAMQEIYQTDNILTPFFSPVFKWSKWTSEGPPNIDTKEKTIIK